MGYRANNYYKHFMTFLKVRESDKPGRFWDTLTEEQKQEVLLAYDESEDENNLIDKERVFRQAK